MDGDVGLIGGLEAGTDLFAEDEATAAAVERQDDIEQASQEQEGFRSLFPKHNRPWRSELFFNTSRSTRCIW